MKRLLVASFVFPAILLASSQNYAQTKPPEPNVVRAAIAAQIPSYWTVKEFSATEAVNYGNAVDVLWKRRFSATLSLKLPTFAEVSRDGPIVLVRPILEADHKKTLYGVSSSTFSAGRWNTSLDVENRFGFHGQPLDYFQGRAIVQGSTEEKKFMASRQENRLEEIRREHETQIAELAAALDQKITALKRHNAQALTELKEEHRSALAKLKAAHQAEVEKFKIELAALPERTELIEKLSRARAKLNDAERAYFSELDTTLAQRKTELEKLIASLKSDNPEEFQGAFDVVIKSDAIWLKRQFLEAALKSNVSKIQQAAIRHAMDDPTLTKPALKLLEANPGLAQKNPQLGELFITRAIESRNSTEQGDWIDRALTSKAIKPMLAETNLFGLDISSLQLERPDPKLCVLACLKNSRCKSMTYVPPNGCWIKHGVPQKSAARGHFSWVR